jgi:hypothetical protein
MSIFLKFEQIVAIENLQKTLDLSTFSFSIRILAISIYIYIYICNHQKKNIGRYVVNPPNRAVAGDSSDGGHGSWGAGGEEAT